MNFSWNQVFSDFEGKKTLGIMQNILVLLLQNTEMHSHFTQILNSLKKLQPI